MLAWRPGELTRRYVDGERAKFVSPMALFLFSVFLMFAVVSNVAKGHPPQSTTMTEHGAVNTDTLYKQDQAKLAAMQAARANVTDKTARAALDTQIGGLKEEINGLAIGLKARDAFTHPVDNAPRVTHFDTGWRWLDKSVGHMSQNPELTLYKLKSYAYKYSWALIPISLPFIWLLFAFRRDVGLYDHAIFSIYSLSFMSLGVVALTLFGRLGIPGALVSLLAILAPPVHMYRQLKGTYRLGRFGAFWRRQSASGVYDEEPAEFVGAGSHKGQAPEAATGRSAKPPVGSRLVELYRVAGANSRLTGEHRTRLHARDASVEWRL